MSHRFYYNDGTAIYVVTMELSDSVRGFRYTFNMGSVQNVTSYVEHSYRTPINIQSAHFQTSHLIDTADISRTALNYRAKITLDGDIRASFWFQFFTLPRC